MTADDPTDSQYVYLLALRAHLDPNHPTDIERLIVELKGVQTACYYLAAVLREMDVSNLSRREEE